MPRQRRIDFPGARHHVMNRGARRAPIFEDDVAKSLFIDCLAELPERFGVPVHAYALMPNHFHLLVETPRGNLSRAMRHLGALFTQRLNLARDWDGPVFRGRFKNRVVGDSGYWRHLFGYVHLNPVPSLVSDPADWAWSSHNAYLGGEAPSWLTMTALESFGSRDAYAAYIAQQQGPDAHKPHGWHDSNLWEPQATDRLCSPLAPHEDRNRAIVVAIDEVVGITGRERQELYRAGRGRRDNRARWVAAWWLACRAGLSHRDIGLELDCRAESVANMLMRMRKSDDALLVQWQQQLRQQRHAGHGYQARLGR